MPRSATIFLIVSIGCFVSETSAITRAQADQNASPIVLQVKGKVLVDGHEVKPRMHLVTDSKIELPPDASLVAITPTQKIEIDGPNSGRVDEILAQTKSPSGTASTGPLGLVYDLFQRGVDVAATRDAEPDQLPDPWSLRLETSGTKCVRPHAPLVVVSPRGWEQRYVRVRETRANDTAFAQIGGDGRLKWPADLPLADDSSYEIRIDGVSSTVSWKIKLAPEETADAVELTKWMIDNTCFDQVNAFALQLPNSRLILPR
jgi:hypothetical protein